MYPPFFLTLSPRSTELMFAPPCLCLQLKGLPLQQRNQKQQVNLYILKTQLSNVSSTATSIHSAQFKKAMKTIERNDQLYQKHQHHSALKAAVHVNQGLFPHWML